MGFLQIPPNEGSSTYGVHERAFPLTGESGQGRQMSLRRRSVGGALAATSFGLLWAFNAFGVAVDVVSLPQDAGTLRGAAIGALRKFAEAPDGTIYLVLGSMLVIGVLLLFGWHPDKGWGWHFRKRSAQGSAVANSDPVIANSEAESRPLHEAEWSFKSLRDLFEEDSNKHFCLGSDVNVEVSGKSLTIRIQVAQQMEGNSKWPFFYIPHSPVAYLAAVGVAGDYEKIMDELLESIVITSSYPGDSATSSNKDLRFSGRVCIYHDDHFDLQQSAALDALFAANGARLILRGPNYAAARNMGDRPDAGSSRPDEGR